MDDFRERLKTNPARRAEYMEMMRQIDKSRRIIYLGSCLLCLYAGFLAGYIMAYPKESRVIAIEVPLEPKAQTTSL